MQIGDYEVVSRCFKAQIVLFIPKGRLQSGHEFYRCKTNEIRKAGNGHFCEIAEILSPSSHLGTTADRINFISPKVPQGARSMRSTLWDYTRHLGGRKERRHILKLIIVSSHVRMRAITYLDVSVQLPVLSQAPPCGVLT
eukprot:4570047-Pleurochrysis_carterae.AAC.1